MCQSLQHAVALAILGLATTIASGQVFPQPYDTQDPQGGLTLASDALQALSLPEGFQATVFASEPDVRQPIALATDARGRLWVAENYTYAERELNFDTDLRDRILILEDADSDGRFDHRTVFWDEGVRVSSVEIGFGGVWVLAAPYLLFLPDRNGDDRPDGPPVVILDGWEADAIRHNLVNGLRWGPDGWLYGRHGIQATSRVGRPGTPEEDRIRINCGVWRYHPTRQVFEVVARGTTNPWGMDWDEHGQLFLINTVIPHLWHVIPGAYYQRMYGEHDRSNLYALLGQTADHVHWDSREAWSDIRDGVSASTDQAGGGHAHAGLMIYQGDNWPDPFRGDVFALNFHGRRINRDRIERSGATYAAKHLPDPIAWSDPWFRGIEILSGPDGGVFVADWSDTGECHENDGVHRSSGRIYKITFGDPLPPSVPDVAALDPLSLVDLLRHPNVWYARQARRVLQEQAASGADLAEAREALRSLFRTREDEVLRLRALWTLFGIGATDEDWLISLLDDSSEHVRTWAVRFLVDTGNPSDSAVDALTRLADQDRSGLVLTFIASSLQTIPTDRRWPLALAIASRSEFAEDPVLPLMLWYGIEPVVPDHPDRAVELAAQFPFGPLARFVARRLMVAAANDPQRVAPILRHTARSDDPALQLAILSGVNDALQGLRRVDPPPGWNAIVDGPGTSRNPELRRLVLALSVVFGDGRALEELRVIALNPEADLSARRDAMENLVRSRADNLLGLLGGLLSDRNLSRDAVRGLSTLNDPSAVELVLDRFTRLPPEARQEAISSLASRPEAAGRLLDAVEAGRIDRGDVSAFLVRQLRTLEDQGITDRVTKLWPEYRPISEQARVRIEALQQTMTPERLASADPARGRILFSQSCAQCHILFDEGSKVGPELTGAQRSELSYLLENLVDPNATLDDDYRMTIFALADGRIINGMIAEQTDRTVTIQTPSDRIIVPADEIEEKRTSELSLMPEGLLDPLEEQEIADLLRYLQSPAQVPRP
ncbi:PVC-type heme-binding CxxCH protein [Tautonia rosea]|uniref:PVC-type heme-binding CxxCH protein n=1 Tax=Tautonia rosea TaxID=2728037 RepID=UPI00147458AD|nr:PVC-type heme-binding CxxCH protein [Tautonia rosea]